MRKLLSMIHIHEWTKWEYITRNVDLFFWGVYERTYVESIRTRECDGCGIRQIREV